MKKLVLRVVAFLCLVTVLGSCNQEVSNPRLEALDVPADVRSRLAAAGYDVTNFAPMKVDGGYLVEGDLLITHDALNDLSAGTPVPGAEQYRTTNIVTGTPRTITVNIAPTFSVHYHVALDSALARYNQLNLSLTFVKTLSSTADIRIVRLSAIDEMNGVISTTGFPSASGNPYPQIGLNGTLITTYGLPIKGVAMLIAHEIGHAIGLRHTDYFNRAYSCGGIASNEGTAGVGATHIPGTPTSAVPLSYMLACGNTIDKPFTATDKIALQYLY